MDSIKLHILSPESTVADIMVEAVWLPGVQSPFEVLKDHAAVLTALDKGEIRWRNASGEDSVQIKGGFVEVGNNEVKACVELC